MCIEWSSIFSTPPFRISTALFTKGPFLLVGEAAADDVLEPVRDQAGDLSEDGEVERAFRERERILDCLHSRIGDARFSRVVEEPLATVVTEAHRKQRDPGDDVAIVHESKDTRPELGIDRIGEVLRADARLSEGVDALHRNLAHEQCLSRAQLRERAAKAVAGDPDRFAAAIHQAPRQDFAVGERHAPHFAKRAVETRMDLAGVLVIPRIARRAEIREPVHRTVRLRATKRDDDRVAAFGDETLRVLVVEEVEGTREAAHLRPFGAAFGRVVRHRRRLGQNLSIGRRKRRRTRFECHGDRPFPGSSRSSIVPSVSPKPAKADACMGGHR